MSDNNLNTRLLHLVALANDYCVAIDNCAGSDKSDFIVEITGYLPRLYFEFSDIEAMEEPLSFPHSYVTEEIYDEVRESLSRLLGEDDSYLETFEEDMKYSDTPIGASISEGLADIYQDLYDFVSAVRDTDADDLHEAFALAKENFKEFWSQTLCNVMRPLNHLRYHGSDE